MPVIRGASARRFSSARIGRISAFLDLTLGLNYGEQKAIAL
jgi:hypothetical protein